MLFLVVFRLLVPQTPKFSFCAGLRAIRRMPNTRQMAKTDKKSVAGVNTEKSVPRNTEVTFVTETLFILRES